MLVACCLWHTCIWTLAERGRLGKAQLERPDTGRLKENGLFGFRFTCGIQLICPDAARHPVVSTVSCSTGRWSSRSGAPPSSCSPTMAVPRSASRSARAGASRTPSTSASPATHSRCRTPRCVGGFGCCSASCGTPVQRSLGLHEVVGRRRLASKTMLCGRSAALVGYAWASSNLVNPNLMSFGVTACWLPECLALADHVVPCRAVPPCAVPCCRCSSARSGATSSWMRPT